MIFLMSVRIAPALLALLLAAPAAPPAGPATTILLVRHAEKAAEPAADPPLTPGGEARARELARVLGRSGAAAVYATRLERTRRTVQPLADALKIPVTPLDQADVDATVRRLLEDHPGRTVVYAGHSDSLPAIVERLCGAKIEMGSEFDNLYIVVASADSTAFLALKYGAR
jgi:broad specificity phosphatase PhoE